MTKISDWQVKGKKIQVVIGTDHGGFEMKEKLRTMLVDQGFNAIDVGAHELDPTDDYSDFGAAVGDIVAKKQATCGILICRSGIGMSIVANRYHNVRAAMAIDVKTAKLGRKHNCSNVLIIPGDMVEIATAKKIVKAWLDTPFSKDKRHIRRLEKLEYETLDEIPSIRKVDPKIAELLDEEVTRQTDCIELIASENFASTAVRQAQGTVLTNKYAEGYPAKRYYNGCHVVDDVESIAIERACKLFGAEAANVQPHSGSQANMAAYFAVIKPGDTIVAMSLDHGGHLTHGHPMNFSGMLYNVIPNGVEFETQYDKPGDPKSLDCTMNMTIDSPLEDPMIHKAFPGGIEDLKEYVMEVKGVKDHWCKNMNDPEDERWEYTYHGRLEKYGIWKELVEGESKEVGEFQVDQIENVISKLVVQPFTRQAQMITWMPNLDLKVFDPPCLQSLWYRILEEDGVGYLNCNVRFRSNDAWGANFMNMFGFTHFNNEVIAAEVSKRTGKEIRLGRMNWHADSFHIYGKDIQQAKERLFSRLESTEFEDRVFNMGDDMIAEIYNESEQAVVDKIKKYDEEH